ncbi:cytochrome c [Mameliella alba]|uniref:c-type cytochrome n=1 Tax=Mameliella alba TaxID=561184 RepID=UPI0013E495D0|nr:c-type cytochrome [Mameliella alba]BBU55054.1 cytochrome c [Mameliella alba]
MGPKAAFIATALAMAAPASADFDAEAFPPYERCALCHGLFGVSANARFPNLAGQEPVYIENQVRAFLSGDRHNDGGQMTSIVTELKPEEIAVVVEWFSTQDPPAPAPQGNAEGRALYEARNCGTCHDAETPYLGVPHLTAQHADYLVKPMRDFRDGTRGTHLGCLPHGPMMPADDSEIAAIAAYLASVPRP